MNKLKLQVFMRKMQEYLEVKPILFFLVCNA